MYIQWYNSGNLSLCGGGGYVGIGNGSPTCELDVTGDIRASGDITAYYSSDKRLKENLKKIENPLEKIEKINGYTFDWKELEGVHINKGHDVGVIAQEIEEVLPEVTVTRENGYKAVRYEKIVPLLIECVKSQQQQIESQQQQTESQQQNESQQQQNKSINRNDKNKD